MEEEVVEDCDWCGQTRELERDHWYRVKVNDDWYWFCSLECRAKWSWENGMPMP